MELPVSYQERMKALLGEEYPDYLASLEKPRLYGLRVNTTKISVDEFEQIAPFPLRRIPYVPNGFFYEGSTARDQEVRQDESSGQSDPEYEAASHEPVQPAKHPYYFAGLYYLQDPSAMTPASRLPVEPGMRVLDLCAAPGGKSTELAARLCGSGILVANDISASRAKALQKNIELFGIANSLITTEYPEKLASYFPGFFDRILIDAPCSGEGMFRKDPAMIRSWTEDSPEKYAAMQEDIVRHALPMLAPGGYLLYSTCTFSPLEDEGTVKKILDMDPSLSLVPMEGYEGFAPGFEVWDDYLLACGLSGEEDPHGLSEENPSLKNCVRIFPHRMEGEGHFLALFQKSCGSSTITEDSCVSHGKCTNGLTGGSQSQTGFGGEETSCVSDGRMDSSTGVISPANLSRDERSLWEGFAADLSANRLSGIIESHGGMLFLNVPDMPEVRGLRFLRNGLYLGECKKNRFEPSQALAMALRMDGYANSWNLSADDERVNRYLKGETIRVEELSKRELSSEEDNTSWTAGGNTCQCSVRDGLVLICVDGYPLGWGKKSGTTIKNKYHSGWRMM